MILGILQLRETSTQVARRANDGRCIKNRMGNPADHQRNMAVENVRCEVATLYELKKRRKELEEIIVNSRNEIDKIDADIESINADCFIIIKGSDVMNVCNYPSTKGNSNTLFEAKTYIKVLPESYEYSEMLMHLYQIARGDNDD